MVQTSVVSESRVSPTKGTESEEWKMSSNACCKGKSSFIFKQQILLSSDIIP